MKTLNSLNPRELLKLKGKQVSYEEMENAKIGTLFVGRDTNDIYELIEPNKIKNRNTGRISKIYGMAMCEYLGIQINDELANAEDF